MEVAPGIVDATAVVLPPPDVVKSLELDLRLPAFDLVDGNGNGFSRKSRGYDQAD